MPANPSPSAATWARRWKELGKTLRTYRRDLSKLPRGAEEVYVVAYCTLTKTLADMKRLEKPASGRKGRKG